MEIKELLKAPQLVVVYAITILYTITFFLAGVIEPSATINPRTIYQEVVKIEAINLNYPEVIRNNSSG